MSVAIVTQLVTQDRPQLIALGHVRGLSAAFAFPSLDPFGEPHCRYVVRVSDPVIDLDAERAELLAMHAAVRRAHFETDPAGVIANDADEWVNVRDGEITVRHREDDLRKFIEYFEGATYYKWDDVEPPIVKLADDASIAWMIIHVRVRRIQHAETQDFAYAGIETYEKRDGRWLKTSETGTFKLNEQ